MLVKRVVKGGAVVLHGRRFRVPDFKAADIEGQTVWVEDDGVIRFDMPRHGVYTERHPNCFFPKYSWYVCLELEL